MSKKLIQAAAGAGGESVYVEDVFSTYLYDGNSSTQTITNGIDLSGEGGLVWIKSRSQGASYYDHVFCDTERGPTKYLASSGLLATSGEQTQTASPADITSFNSDGFSLAADNTFYKNVNGEIFTSWSFRKQAGFFDVVTYTGDGSVQSVNHNLGSVPACMIVKRTDSTGDWYVYHVDLGAGINGRKALKLNETSAASDSGGFSDHPTDTAFTVNYAANTSGATYVAYLFAHDDQSFGDDSDESIIKCGTYTSTGNTATGIDIDLGWEPQWILQKNISSTSTSYWMIADTMRGLVAKDGSNYPDVQVLKPNATDAEADPGILSINSTGFTSHGGFNNGDKIIYIAIRRPMKTPEAGTEVFAIDTRNGSGTTTEPNYQTNFPVDMELAKEANSTSNWSNSARLIQGKYLVPNTTASEGTQALYAFDYQNGWFASTATNANSYSWMFKRATGFFDVVAYTGDGVNGRDVIHNLKVLPEFVIIKERNSSTYWLCWHKDINDYYLRLNDTNAAAAPSTFWDHSTYPVTSTSFPIGTHGFINGSGDSYIAYLFATLDGVSKVGSFTSSGTDINIDCGFTSGARFVLLKKTNDADDWFVWDTARGIVAGNDKRLKLNTSDAEATGADNIDPYSAGFTLTSGIIGSGNTFIYLAIA